MDSKKLNHFSEFLVKTFSKEHELASEKGMTVNPIVSEIASWYEKLRNAIEYREDEVILRASIERILKRRLILGGNGKSVAGPLVRELIWARYFPDGSIEEEMVQEVGKTVDLYLHLRRQILTKHKFKETTINTWMYQLMSSHLEQLLNPNIEKETMSNFIFHILSKNVEILDDSQEAKDVQVYIAICKAYAKNDLALLRYNLFNQFFGKLNSDTLETTSQHFPDAYKEIESQLSYPLRHKIFTYVKRQIPPFLILEDILRTKKGEINDLLQNPDEFSNTIIKTCDIRYKSISAKVRRAIVRSVIFILLSKVFIAFAIEGTYENIMFGKIMWGTIALNITIPTFFMIAVGFLIRTPDKDNSKRVVSRISSILFDDNPKIGREIKLRKVSQTSRSALTTIFTISWLATFILSFGLIMFTLTKLNFTIVSEAIFMFFLAIVSFLAYRINQTAKLYTVDEKPNLLTPIVDFFFMPIARVGRYLTEGISQINIFLFILDYVIETPFKGLFSFFEQWFLFLHSKREDLG